MQEAFVGKDASVQVPNRNAIIDANFRLIKLIRGLKIPIVWTQVYLDKWNYSVYSELWPEHFNGDRIRVLSKDNMDSKIVDKLLKEISREDLIIPKHRYSAFYNPELKKWLITNHIENILFSGVTTNVCVESTIRDAFQLGFRPFLISDATGTFSEELKKLQKQLSVLSSDILSA